MWRHIIFHPRTCDRGGSGPYSLRVSDREGSEDRGGLWGGCVQGWSSWVWVLCGYGGLWEAWVRGSACGSERFLAKHHCGRVYPGLRLVCSWWSWARNEATSATRAWMSIFGNLRKCRGGEGLRWIYHNQRRGGHLSE
jgi:hypothetical protein